jgi:hypothetical protein
MSCGARELADVMSALVKTSTIWVAFHIALAAAPLSVFGQEPPLPAATTETPRPTASPTSARPQLSIPEIPFSVEPPTLVPNSFESPPISKPILPATVKNALPLEQLDAAFQRSPLAQAAEEQRLHLEWRQLQNITAQDEEVVAAKEAAAAAKTDREKRTLLRAYYEVLYAHMRALASTPEVKAYLDSKKAAALGSLAQPRVRPEPTPLPKSR